MFRITAMAVLAAPLMLGACSSGGDDDSDKIVAASPTAVTITTLRFTEPTGIAERHCAKFGRKAVSQGGVKLGAGYKTMWGFDCVDPQ